MATDAQRITAFDALFDAMRSVHEEQGTPFDEEQLTQKVYELVFEGSPTQIQKTIAALKQLIAA